MVQNDLRLERQGKTLILRAKHNAHWVGALVCGLGICFIVRIYGTGTPGDGGPALAAYSVGILFGAAAVAIGAFLLIPREVITTFDRRTHRVLHHLTIGRGWYAHRRAYAFQEIEGLRLTGYDAESDSYMPAIILRNGKTLGLSTANGSYVVCAVTIAAICAETGLDQLGLAR